MNNEFLSNVFKWFGLGLLVTFLVAYAVSINESLLQLIFSGGATIVIVILELVYLKEPILQKIQQMSF